MKKWFLFAVLFSCLYGASQIFKSPIYPKPDNGETLVNRDVEEGTEKNKREKWFELLHQAAPGVEWKTIEKENRLKNAQVIYDLRKKRSHSRNDDEWVADNHIFGAWYERGSANQAGNIMASAYDVVSDEIFVVSGGGSVFKGNRAGFGWEVVNQDYKFSGNLMEVIQLSDGRRRILCSVNHSPAYSDDEGQSWKISEQVVGTDGSLIYNPQMTKQQKLFLLHKRNHGAPIRLYYSLDLGESYSSVHNFVTSDTRNVALSIEEKNQDIFVISQKSGNTSQIFKFNFTTEDLELLTDNSPIGFGTDGDANLQSVQVDGQTHLYVYDGDRRFHVSKDFGVTWEYLSTMPTKPWAVHLYVSPSEPKNMIYGEVDAFRSRDGGKTWQKINAWWEYYNNVASKLHADIMSLKEFVDQDENPFILIGNHGGISITYDAGVNNDNIGMFDLNVSQYYDVKSYPLDYNFVFAGAQDQGFQKGFIPGTNTENFVQVVSGDYGHIAFTENGQRLWTVYPGGWVTYYPNPRSAGHSASFEVNSDNESVWIPPLVSSPLPQENIVYMAGGNINGGTGSHLIKLQYFQADNRIEATQSPFNFRASGGELSAMAFSPFNPQKVFCATTNGRFYISQNGGQNFSLHGTSLPGAQYLYGSCILPSAIDSNLVYMSGSGYSNAGVMVSRNGGKSFTALDNGLPKTMVFKIVFNEDESLIYAATEAGPYVYIKELNSWHLLSGSNTPNQTFWSVEYINELKIARFGTYGRGIWDFHYKDISTSSEDEFITNHSISVYPNPVNDHLIVESEKPFSNLTRKIEVVDIQGVKYTLPFVKISANQIRIQTETLQTGIYFLVVPELKKGYLQKFIKL